jgi:hypothetical protein
MNKNFSQLSDNLASSKLEIQLQLKIPLLLLLNSDLWVNLIYNSDSKFRFGLFWILVFKLSRRSKLAVISLKQNFDLVVSAYFLILLWRFLRIFPHSLDRKQNRRKTFNTGTCISSMIKVERLRPPYGALFPIAK